MSEGAPTFPSVDRDLDLSEQGRLAGSLGELTDELVAAERKRIERVVFAAIKDETLTERQAVLAWMEVAALATLQSKLAKMQRRGVSAAHRIEESASD